MNTNEAFNIMVCDYTEIVRNYEERYSKRKAFLQKRNKALEERRKRHILNLGKDISLPL